MKLGIAFLMVANGTGDRTFASSLITLKMLLNASLKIITTGAIGGTLACTMRAM